MSHETRMSRLGLNHLIGADEKDVLRALDDVPETNMALEPFEALQWRTDLKITKDEIKARIRARNEEED